MSGLDIQRSVHETGRVVAGVGFALSLMVLPVAGWLPVVKGEDRRPLGAPDVPRVRPAVPADRMSEYEYAFDPYTWRTARVQRLEPGYLPPRSDVWLYPSIPEMTRGLGQAPRVAVGDPAPEAPVYGYVDVETQEPGPPEAREPWTYYYDRAGRLRFSRQVEVQPFEEPLPRPPAVRSPAWDVREEPTPQVESFEGRVIGFSTVTSPTDNRVHVVARIEQPNGVLVSVQMGPIESLQLQRNDWLEGFGTHGVLRGRPTILARRVAVNGVWRTIQAHVTREIRDYSGEIRDIQVVPIQEIPEPQGVAQLRLDTGGIERALLGPVERLQREGLRIGDRVTLWARAGTLNGTPVMVAQQLEFDGRRLQMAYDPQRMAFDAR